MKKYMVDIGYLLELHITCPKTHIYLNGDLVAYFKKQYNINRRLTNSAKQEILEHYYEINLSQAIVYVSQVQDDLTKLITKWSILSPQTLYNKDSDFEKWSENVKAEFLRQHEILINILKDRHESLSNLREFIVDLIPQITTPSGKAIKRIKGLKERIRFEGSFNALVTIFYGLSKAHKISFNKENSYATDETHFSDFLENTFHYKSGRKYLPAENTAVALARLRESPDEGGGDLPALKAAKEEVDSMLSDTIKYLSEYRKELRDQKFLKRKVIIKN